MPPQYQLCIAIIGSGITGISAACEILDAGLECRIFEALDEGSIGGIWARQNKTSSLQIHSEFYRFHPKIKWSCTYPRKAEILQQTRQLWDQYRLRDKTFFNCPVKGVSEANGGYIINDEKYGVFDSIIVAVGTCGEPFSPNLLGQEVFLGQSFHSSNLDSVDMAGKEILIVGGGASTLEAMEHAISSGASAIKVVTRSDKWVVPRWRLLNCIMALIFFDPFGLWDRILGFFLRSFYYHGLENVAPSRSGVNVYSETPIINSAFFDIIRSGSIAWTKGECRRFVQEGMEVIPHSTAANPEPEPYVERCDICIYATGYKRPSLGFLENFGNGHRPPSWFLQVFPPGTPTICAINSTWVHGIGSVGGAHIGIYSRLLVAYTLDAEARPSLETMSTWVWLVDRVLKPLQGLSFVTTGEVYLWFLLELAFKPALWRWRKFILYGNQSHL